MRKHNEHMQKSKNVPQSTKPKMSSSEKQLTIQLILVTSALLILTAPQYIRFIIYIKKDKFESAESFANFDGIQSITSTLLTSNSSVNFFLYCFGGSKFRRETLQILTCNKNNSVGTSSSA